MENLNKANHIRYVDIAKGLCMLFVIWNHVCAEFTKNVFVIYLNQFITAYYMPLFFIISGIFIKNEPMGLFLKKKSKTILLPFFIFYVLSFFVTYLASNYLGASLHNEFKISNIFAVFYSQPFSNGALWFLVALFFSVIIIRIALYFSSWWKQLCIILPISVLGFYWRHIFDFRLPLYMDTAFTASLFIFIGFTSSKYKNQLNRNKIIILSMIGLLFIVFLLRQHGGKAMASNYYDNNIIAFYIVGFSGSLFLILFSALIRKSAYLEYIGKFSIIPLCTHYFFINPLKMIVVKLNIPDSIGLPVSYMVICILMIPVIYIINTYFPFLIGKSVSRKPH